MSDSPVVIIVESAYGPLALELGLQQRMLKAAL